jgi:hypothetical protein
VKTMKTTSQSELTDDDVESEFLFRTRPGVS